MFRTLLLRALIKLAGPPKRYRIFPQYRQPSITGLTADDVADAVIAAESGDATSLLALYDQVVIENSHLQTELSKRKLAVLGDPLTVTSRSESPEDEAAKEFVEAWTDDSPDWLNACISLMDSVVYPVALNQIWFEPGGASRRYTARLAKVDSELLDFRTGELCVFDTVNGVKQGTSHKVTPEAYVVHRGHLLTLPDSWGGPMRSLLGWHLLSHTTPEWWGRFLERLGAPFMVATISSGDDGDREKVEQAFSQALRLFGIVVSEGTKVEMLQANSAQTGEAHEKLHDKCCREISKLINGQTSSSDVQKSGGLNQSGDAHETVRSEFRDWDATRLADTLTKQVIVPLLRINGLTGRPPKLTLGVIDVKQAELSAALISALPAAGLELTDDGVAAFSERIGLPLQRIAARPSTEVPRPFSAETSRPIRRADLIDAANERLRSAAAPRLARRLAAVELPDTIEGTGAEVLLEYLETTIAQGR
jgi:phage gp29-like protein